MELNTENKQSLSSLGDAPELMQKHNKPGVPRAVTSEALFAGKRELLIQHANDNYRLRITNQGKLILTK